MNDPKLINLELLRACRLLLARLEEYPDAAGGIALECGHLAVKHAEQALKPIPERALRRLRAKVAGIKQGPTPRESREDRPFP